MSSCLFGVKTFDCNLFTSITCTVYSQGIVDRCCVARVANTSCVINWTGIKDATYTFLRNKNPAISVRVWLKLGKTLILATVYDLIYYRLSFHFHPFLKKPFTENVSCLFLDIEHGNK